MSVETTVPEESWIRRHPVWTGTLSVLGLLLLLIIALFLYPRYPLHALAEYMRLGFAAERDAASNKPGVDRLIVITNANDQSINNGIVAQFEELWQQHGEEFMRSYQFEKDLGLPHDVITPTREDGNTALTYPIIIDYITDTEE